MDSKWILRSRTFLGVLIAALPGVFALFGWHWSADYASWINQSADAVLLLAGIAMTAYGRIKAAHDATPVTLVPRP